MTVFPPILAQAVAGGSMAASAGSVLVAVALAALLIASSWKVAVKTGHPGWTVLVPVYNVYVLTRAVGRPAWWIALMFVPGVNLVVAAVLLVDLARSFGKDIGFAVGLILLHPLFLAVLGFGSAQYVGPSVAEAMPSTPLRA